MKVIVPTYPSDLELPFDEFRPGQRLAIRKIMDQFRHKKVVILEGPTGSGKSLIGMAVASMMETQTVVTTQTKQLARQYQESFPFAKVLEGRSNFDCPLSPGLDCASGPCIAGFKCEEKKTFCPYYIQKEEAVASGCIITNIWYFINEVNYVGELRGRGLLIVDEGHLLEQALLSVISLDISSDQFARVGISRIPKMSKVGDAVAWAHEVLPAVERKAEKIVYEVNPKSYVRHQQQLHRLKDIIKSVNEEEWLLTRSFYGYTLKPVWVTKWGSPWVFDNADKTLVMSATIRDPEQFSKTLGIRERDMAYVEMPSYFPKENRPINFWPVAKIGYKSSQNELLTMVEAVDSILERHEGQKGVLHTVSYKLRDLILENTIYPDRFIYHDWKNRDEIIKQFKNSPGDFVLISPSVSIGLDLPDDQGRFNIIAKVPWLDLSDEQVSRRRKEDPSWYVWSTACALIQSTGRTTRSDEDWSISYILDGHAEWFMKRNSRLFPSWWKEAVYRIDGIESAVVPERFVQSIF